MNCKFHINDFEGPLDLLLHLVKQSKMDLYDIEISIIIDEYLEFINLQEVLNIDNSSEYLVMAAELIHLKSKRLIGKDDDVNEDDEFSIISEDDLKNKLIEYQRYKDITTDFLELKNKRSEFFTKSPESLKNLSENSIVNNGEISLNDLVNAFMSMQEREELKKPINTKITRKEYSVGKRIIKIRELLQNKKRIQFEELFDIFTKEYIIVTFLSILEMTKNSEIIIKQNTNFGTIEIEKR